MHRKDYYKQPNRASLDKLIMGSSKVGNVLHRAHMHVMCTHIEVIEHLDMDPILIHKVGKYLKEELQEAALDITLTIDELREVIFLLDLVEQTVAYMEEYLSRILSS